MLHVPFGHEWLVIKSLIVVFSLESPSLLFAEAHIMGYEA